MTGAESYADIDRASAPLGALLRAARRSRNITLQAVSYTHLDVYKRQDHIGASHVVVLDPETLDTKHVWPVGVYPDKIVVVGEP